MVGPLGALPTGPAASTTEVEDDIADRPLGSIVGGSNCVHYQILKTTSMAGPWGVLPVGPSVSTTEFLDDVDGGPPGGAVGGSGSIHHRVRDDVDGGPPGGRCLWVQQRPPPSLKMTSMAAPLGVMPVGLAGSTTKFETTSMEGPLGSGAGGSSRICHLF
jgi:hypothetical protein